jgi:alkylation response protein AidB-like acyl-CoA dehydrogenase
MPPFSQDQLQAIDGVQSALCGSAEFHSPVAWRKALSGTGLPGLDVPQRVGGGGWSARHMADAFALFGRISLDLRDVPGAGHGRILLLAASRRFDDVLRRAAAGQEFVAVAITEEHCGSDLHAIATVAEPTAGGYLLTGCKVHVARMEQATRAVVFARVNRAGDARTLSAFLLPLRQPGVMLSPLAAMGLHGVSFGKISFERVFVPAADRVGGEGEGFALFGKHFPYWRMVMAAAAVGCARGAIDRAADWLRQRHAFGGPIGRFTHLQQALAAHLARLHMAWLLVASVAERLDRREPAYTDAAMAKAEAVEAAVAAVQWAMEVHGAAGYCEHYDLEKRLRDLLGLRIADGTTDVLRGQVARAVLGEDLYQQALNSGRPRRTTSWMSGRRYW